MEVLAKIAEILAVVEKAADGSIVSDIESVISAVEAAIADFKGSSAPASDSAAAE